MSEAEVNNGREIPGLGKSLSKKERLSGTLAIGRLLSKGKYRNSDNFRYCFAGGSGLPYSRILISVPKKNFRRAVKRNLLKRRIREAYRQNKALLEAKGVDIMFVYNQKEIRPFADIERSVKTILSEINSVK